jgi:glycosyltransferase A (GT-A) superfamily protein (DUF2064 family)
MSGGSKKVCSNDQTVFAIFTKIPGHGIPIKSRLQATTPLSQSQTDTLACAFIADTVATVLSNSNNPVAMISDPLIDRNNLIELFTRNNIESSIYSTPVDFYPQLELPFGQRLQAALVELASQYHAPTILVGTDTPTLSVAILTRASQIVQAGAFAIGPSFGGGFYLVGLPDSAIENGFSLENLFSDPKASELQRLCEEVIRVGSQFELLSPQFDIDTGSDLVTLLDLLPALEFQNSANSISAYPEATARILRQLGVRVVRSSSDNRETEIEVCPV